MLSDKNPIKKQRQNDEENTELVNENQDEEFQITNPNSILRCMQSNSYCLSFMDYMKKFVYLSHIDFHRSYIELLYCFQPDYISEDARNRKSKFF